MKTRVLVTGLKILGLGAILLAACSTGNAVAILFAVALVLFVLASHSKLLTSINTLMLVGAGLGLFIGLAASQLARDVRHDGFGAVVHPDGDGGLFAILLYMGFWLGFAAYAKRFIPLARNEDGQSCEKAPPNV